jgi:hypothetical protein
VTLLSCERTGRSYGGGVLKLEPREADRILLPSLDLIARHRRALARLAPQVDAALRTGGEALLNDAVAAIDSLLLGDEIGSREACRLRSELLARRRARARPRRGAEPRPSLPS